MRERERPKRLYSKDNEAVCVCVCGTELDDGVVVAAENGLCRRVVTWKEAKVGGNCPRLLLLRRRRRRRRHTTGVPSSVSLSYAKKERGGSASCCRQRHAYASCVKSEFSAREIFPLSLLCASEWERRALLNFAQREIVCARISLPTVFILLHSLLFFLLNQLEFPFFFLHFLDRRRKIVESRFIHNNKKREKQWLRTIGGGGCNDLWAPLSQTSVQYVLLLLLYVYSQCRCEQVDFKSSHSIKK